MHLILSSISLYFLHGIFRGETCLFLSNSALQPYVCTPSNTALHPSPPPLSKSQQRVLESLQASLDVEVKGKAEGLKLKKKLEADINELELQVDLFTKSNAELSKNGKKTQQQIKVR